MRRRGYISAFLQPDSTLTLPHHDQRPLSPPLQHQTLPFPNPPPPSPLAFTYLSIDPYDETLDSHETMSQVPEPPHTNGNDTEVPDFEDQLIAGVDLYTILTKAQENLLTTRNLGRCGAIPGVQGTYAATRINGWPSHTMAWWCYKKEMEAKDFIRSAGAWWQESSSPTLLEHFFS